MYKIILIVCGLAGGDCDYIPVERPQFYNKSECVEKTAIVMKTMRQEFVRRNPTKGIGFKCLNEGQGL